MYSNRPTFYTFRFKENLSLPSDNPLIHKCGQEYGRDKLCLREWASKLAKCIVLVTLQLFLFLSFFAIKILNFLGMEIWIKVWSGQVLDIPVLLTSFGLSESLVKNKPKEKGRAYILGLGLRCPLHTAILKSCRLWLLLPSPSIPDIHH